MATKTVNNIVSYLTSSHLDLKGILAKCQQLEKINSRFMVLLDKTLHGHCRVANTSNQRLVLLVSNGSIATQLRLSTPDLLRQCQSDPLLARFQIIEIIVRPAISTPKKTTTSTVKLLSSRTADIIRDMAENLSDQSLKEIMERISQHSEKK